MNRVIIACVLLLSGSAFADHHTVRIGSEQYSTGYLPMPKDTPRTYFQLGYEAADVPESYDARTEGRVTPIKNQGGCGSCWSFARARALETAWIDAGKATNETIDLAEQDALVNDSTAYGCQGGFMDGRFETNQGVTTEALCPYRASDRVACRGTKLAKASKWAMIGGSNRTPTVDELKAAIYEYGTIAVTVAAGGSFSPNSQGRITSCGGRGLNHMVTLQGYRPSSDGGVEFLIGNSWGTSWGDRGYAWSKQGCNQLASVAGDAALFFYVEDEDDDGGDDPVPVPAPIDGIPYSVVAARGKELALQAKPVAGYKYKWTVGTMVQTGARVYITTTTPVDAVLEVTDPAKNKTTYTVSISVK